MSCTPAATTSTSPPSSVRPPCWARGARTLPGRFVFVFQPGEEALCGAKAMVEGGALDLMEGSRLVGFHVTSQIPTGLVALRGGVTMSEAHSLHITLTGPGGHGAMPTGQGDVIVATAELVDRLGGVADGLTFEGANCVCSAGTLTAGTAVNVVPTTAQDHGDPAHLHGRPARRDGRAGCRAVHLGRRRAGGADRRWRCPSTRRRW